MHIYMEHATEEDYDYLVQYDVHMPQERLRTKIAAGEINMIRLVQGSVAESVNDSSHRITIGWLRYGWFWDHTPFMNLLWLAEDYRGQGIGKQIVQLWEQQMTALGCSSVMTSTQSDEEAQHFYRKLGYKDAGALMQENAAMEIISTKTIVPTSS
ncbi:GNAT family N-acetyltransferase [Paenibacillus wenxiniae]|uniref:GNAT family N-acetyltransferase n=1 Tax=Paenibacillus wenxiniae TaxID=1636843 RepID=A0ABW4RKY9_9BACL